MNDEQLIGRRLGAVAVPSAEAARDHTAMAARGAVAGAHPGRLSGARVAIALAAGAAVVGFCFTPPGRAIADEFARLVGIGSPPTVDQSTQTVTPQAGSTPIVIGEGVVPQGGPRFEIVAYEGRRSDAMQARIERDAEEVERAGHPFPPSALRQELGTCVSLDWPESIDSQGGDFCIDGPQVNPLPNPGYTDYEDKLGPGGRLAITGLVGPEVDRLDALYTDVDGDRVLAPVTLAHLDDTLAEQAGATERFGSYVAFIPDADVGPGGLQAEVMTTVELVGYDAAGDELKRLDYGALISNQIHQSQVEAERLEQLRRDAERNPVPGQSAATCPSIARAFEEAGRDPSGISIGGRRCPDLEEVRRTLERYPQLGEPRSGAGTSIDPEAPSAIAPGSECAELVMKAVKLGRISEGQDPLTYPADLQRCVG